MVKKCGNCGNTFPDDVSVFCNKCGARLPVQDVLTCGSCGKTFSDMGSQFCNRCGSPLTSAVQTATPAIPATKGKNCPACGFENFGENRFYCKKCGAYILKSDPIRNNEPAGKAESRIKKPSINIKADSPNIGRLKDSHAGFGTQELPLITRKDTPKKSQNGSYRKFAVVGAGVILLVIIIGIFVVFSPGILPTGPVDSKEPGLASQTSLQETVTAISGSPGVTIEIPSPAQQSQVIKKTIPSGSQATINDTPPWSQGIVNNTPPWDQTINTNNTPPWSQGIVNNTPPWDQTINTNNTPPWSQLNGNNTPPWLI